MSTSNPENSKKILLVEDNPGDANLVKNMLKEAAFAGEIAHAGKLAEIKTEKPYDLILLDLNLPDSEGLNTVFNVHKLLPDAPIVVLTGLDSEAMSLSSIQAGAQDYLVKGETTPGTLKKTIQYALSRYQTLKEINHVSGDNKKPFWASHNPLTGLPNQQLFFEQLQVTIEKHHVTKQTFGLMLLKLHEMEKIINLYGHTHKDKVIKNVAARLMDACKTLGFFLAHYDEDTFIALSAKQFDAAVVAEHVKKCQHALSQSISIGEEDYFPSYSIGFSVFPFDGVEIDSLIQSAQTAMKSAAKKGIQNYEIYTQKMTDLKQQNNLQIWHSDLKFALERKEFFIVYQPQVDVKTQKICGVEALIRWHHPRLGLIEPEKFIPIAEDSHLIVPIGAWILEETMRQYHLWQRNNISLPLRIGINVSANQLEDNSLINEARKVLEKYQVPPHQVELELTENIFISQPEAMINKLDAFKKSGMQTAIDDFGRGYSSFSYLSHLPVNHLKLDMSLIQGAQASKTAKAVVQSIINLAHSLELGVIAEGVETEAQYELLKQQTCDEIQGYYFSKPIQPDEVSHLIDNGLSLPES